jgi:hypothetical protein
MGMFDYYNPKPQIACPVCETSNLEWQGKAGPCALFVWEQGQAAPVDQMASEDCRLPAEKRAGFRLPLRFEIYAQCACPTFLNAVGFTEHGFWTQTELLNPDNAVANPHESEREFKKRLAAYIKHPGHEG